VRESKQHFSTGAFLDDFRQTRTLNSETGILKKKKTILYLTHS